MPAAAATMDGGYAWLVLVASCLLQLFGLGFSIGGVGVMLVSFSKVFPHVDVGQISWIGSFRSFQFLASPIAVLLIKRFGCRAVTIAGALLSAAGIAVSSLSTEVWHVYLTFGVVGGIGVAFTYTTSTAILGEYFDKRKNIAFPVSCLGNSLGLLVFPYALQAILERTSHDVALYIMAALKAVEIACGIVFKPNRRRDADSAGAPPHVLVAAVIESGGAPKNDANSDALKKNVVVVVSETGDPRYQATVALVAGEVGVKKAPELSPLTGRGDTAFADCHEAVVRTTSNGSSSSNCSSVGSTAPTIDQDASGSGRRTQPMNGGSAALRMARLLRDWQCWVLVLHAFAWGFCVVSAEVLAPISVQRRGLSDTDASLGITILGAGMLVSSFVMLGVGNRQYDRFALYLPMSGLLGLASILLSVSDLTVAYFVICGAFGILFGVLVSLFLSVLSDYKSAEDYADLFGLYILFNGIGGIAGPAAMGSIQASAGDSAGWYTVGSVGIVGSLMLVPVYVIRRRQRRS